MTHFELNFCEWCKEGVQVYSFACRYSVVPATLLKRLLFFHFLDTIVKNQLTINVSLFLDFQFFSIEYMPILIPVPHCLDYYCLVGSFEIRKCESFDFVLF